jgi:hypothetical protein
MKKLVSPLNIEKTIEAIETLNNWHEVVDKELLVMWLRQNLAIKELTCQHSYDNLGTALKKRKLFLAQERDEKQHPPGQS